MMSETPLSETPSEDIRLAKKPLSPSDTTRRKLVMTDDEDLPDRTLLSVEEYKKTQKLRKIFSTLLLSISHERPDNIVKHVEKGCKVIMDTNADTPKVSQSQQAVVDGALGDTTARLAKKEKTERRRKAIQAYSRPRTKPKPKEVDPEKETRKKTREEQRKAQREKIAAQKRRFVEDQMKRNSLQKGRLQDDDQMFLFVGRAADNPYNIPTFNESEFEMLSELGKGNYGVVFSALEKSTGQKVAIKILRNSGLKMERTVKAEYDMQRDVDHPNVVKAMALYADDLNLYIIQELLEGGELLEAIRRREDVGYDEATASKVFAQLLSAVAFMHARNIGHFDLKPQNILCVNDEQDLLHTVKITDFGVSKHVTPDQLVTSFVGTPQFCAPEIIKRQPFGSQVDCWSLGCVLYVMLSGRGPFDIKDRLELNAAIKSGNVDLESPPWDLISAEAKDLIKKLICVDHETRLTAEQALEHEWLSRAVQQKTPLKSAVKEMRQFNLVKRESQKSVTLLKVTQTYLKKVMKQKSLDTIKETDGGKQPTPTKTETSAPQTPQQK